MKIIPLHGRGAGVGCPQPAGPTPKATPSAPPQRGFSLGEKGLEEILALNWKVKIISYRFPL
ncbi:MAG: hypothetical protein DMG05_11290 [Acidobacteria bacterium]|nr:MAG: hypothetical protein DMG05_11290 [Acidobacteriota bacterium]